MNLKKLLALFLLAPALVWAQSAPPAVQQSGSVTASHIATWVGNNTIQDGGVAGTGNVSGPASATANDVAGYNGTTGKTILDTGLLYTSLVSNTGSWAQGDILYYNGTAWTLLAPGTAGNFLETLGAGANPAWASASAGGVSSFTGDGFLLGNSASTGVVTAAQKNHTANSVAGALTATVLSDLAVPSCSTASSALKWTSGTGYGCNSSITAAAVSGETFPGSGIIVGTTDTQTLTGKSIAGSEINSGTVPTAQLPTATASALGVAQADGTTITASAGVLSAVQSTGSLLGVQVFITTGATYTPTSGTTHNVIYAIGGGGGGGGSGTSSPGAGGNGGATSVGTLINVPGGNGGAVGTASTGGVGGAGGGACTTATLCLPGSAGEGGLTGVSPVQGTLGAPGFWGAGAGAAGGGTAGTNTGAGGGGAIGSSGVNNAGGAGGAGSTGISYSSGITGTYGVTIGAGGTAGTTGGTGAGGAGAKGVVIIYDYK